METLVPSLWKAGISTKIRRICLVNTLCKAPNLLRKSELIFDARITLKTGFNIMVNLQSYDRPDRDMRLMSGRWT